jgi:hypothetical protein
MAESRLPDAPWLVGQVRAQGRVEAGLYAKSQLPDAPWVEAPQKRRAEGVLDAVQAGYQSSGTGLALRGKLPDVVLDPQHSKWYENLAATGAQFGSDIIQSGVGMVAGAAAGTATAGPLGGIIGGGAGAFAVPTAIRESLTQAYEAQAAGSSGDWLSRAGIVLKHTAKDALVGAATFGAGTAAARLAGGVIAPAIGTSMTTGAARTAIGAASATAEIGTMVVTPSLLEGKLPEPQDFSNAAILLLGVKGVGKGVGKLHEIYRRTGIPPEQVVADARVEPTIGKDLASEKVIPTAYEKVASETNAIDAVPGVKAQEVAKSPFAEVTQAKGEPARPTEVNYNYINSPDDVKGAMARLSQVYEAEIQTQRRGTVSWEQTSAEAADKLAGILGTRRDPGAAVSPAEILARRQMTVGAVEDMMGARDNLLAKGENATPADQLAFLQSIERSAMVQAEFLGARAEAGRALNILKSTAFEAGRVKQIQDAIQSMGGVRAPKSPQTAKFVANKIFTEDAVIAARALLKSKIGTLNSGIDPQVLKAGMTIAGAHIEAGARTFAAFSKAMVADLGDAIKPYLKELYEKTNESIKAEHPEVLKNPPPTQAASDLLARFPNPLELAAKLKEIDTPEGAAKFAREFQTMSAQAERLNKDVQATLTAHAGDPAALLRELDALADRRQSRGMSKDEARLGVQDVRDLIEKHRKNPAKLAEVMKEISTPEGAAKFFAEATKATMWQKYMEALKAVLVSGPVTQIKNIGGNLAFMASRPVVDVAAATIGRVTNAPERVSAMEPFARVYGNAQGFAEAMRIAGSFTKSYWNHPMEALRQLDKPSVKGETFKQAIEGDLGVIIRTPFTGLSMADALFKLMNGRGEANALAIRQAVREGFNPSTREFMERVEHIKQNPDAKMQEAITAAEMRMTFNSDLGNVGQAVQKLLKAAPALQMEMPFVRTPGNVVKEMIRMTPAAPLIREWREAIAKGGPEAHKAIAEVTVGFAIANYVWSAGGDIEISGYGDPDPQKRTVQMAAGWQPYSIRYKGGTWRSYEWMQPLGTLVGLVADMKEVHERMDAGETNDIAKMIGIAFAQSVTNQTMLQGAFNLMRAITEPDRYWERFAQGLAAMHVPGALGQTAQLTDPLVREIHSVMDAVRNRIPGQREQLLPKRDPFGEPVANRERTGVISPIRESVESTDKVRTEAARLQIGVAKAPKSIQLPRVRDRELGKIELTPEQRDIFTDVAGHAAYAELSKEVNAPDWDAKPDMDKKLTYELVFERTRKAGAAAAVGEAQRQLKADQVQEEIDRRRK